jgi:hypothetical protein
MHPLTAEQRLDHLFALVVLARGASRRGRTGFYGFVVVSVG